MNSETETKQLIEDAAKLLGIVVVFDGDFCGYEADDASDRYTSDKWLKNFNPLDPERGDLMKVAMAAKLCIDYEDCEVHLPWNTQGLSQIFNSDDYQSLALAILRAVSAVLKARGEA